MPKSAAASWRKRRRTFVAILMRGQQLGQIRSSVDVSAVVDALYGAIHHRLLVTRQPIDERFVAALAHFAASGRWGWGWLVTQIGDSVVGERHDTAVAALTPDQVAAVAWVTIAINALNRVAIISHYTVEPST